jgi:hypothetical protein
MRQVKQAERVTREGRCGAARMPRCMMPLRKGRRGPFTLQLDTQTATYPLASKTSPDLRRGPIPTTAACGVAGGRSMAAVATCEVAVHSIFRRRERGSWILD